MKTARHLTLWLGLLLGAAAPARAWWDSEWSIRKKVVIDTAVADAAISDPVGGAVVLLRLHDGNFQFSAAKEDGSDIRIVSEDDKSLLPYSVERYDSMLNEAFLWVKVPEIKAGGKTSFWIYYGSASPKATRVEDAKTTYDANTALVYHFGDKTGTPTDATGRSGAAEGLGQSVVGSLIGGGLRLDGRKGIQIPTSNNLIWNPGAALTWSLWIKPGPGNGTATIFSRREGSKAFVVGLENGTPYVEVTADGTPQKITGKAVATPNEWHHLAVMAESGKLSLYIDGEASAAAAAPLPALSGGAVLGGDTSEGATAFNGEIDELYIAGAVHPAGWAKLAFLSQGGSDKASKIISVGQDEQTKSWMSEGYFGVIIKSLTADGWVVIGILSVMAAISWVVMVSKVRYLNALAKGNRLFMKQWAHVASDLTVLDHGGDQEKTKSLGGRLDPASMRAMRSSSVYRIYHIGVEEIRHRLAAEHHRKFLSSRSIQSIRASLDGGLVREKQRIDKMIVLLTICISGGPFLGLLGTVIGVMITFAAVAAAGDVNVNAIAPGIAAALLATVAGLAVAIPSLFGYNYILSRVKDATADMHVFIDEFITRMAEFYSEQAEHKLSSRTSASVSAPEYQELVEV